VYTRPWGTYETLAVGDGYQIKIITVNPKACLSLQKHFKRFETWTITKANRPLLLAIKNSNLQTKILSILPVNTLHCIKNTTDEPVEFVEVQTGSYFGEDDIIRVKDIYNR